MTRRLLALPALFAAGLAWGYWRGFAAPVLYGVKAWADALHRDPTDAEGDYLA